MTDWTELLAPLTSEMNRTLVLHFRDPFAILAMISAVLGVAMTMILVLVGPTRFLRWILGKTVGISSFFGLSSGALCLLPHNRGLFFSRVQAGIAVSIVTVSVVFIIIVYKRSRHRAPTY